jgi:hypothetical protein
MPGQDEDIKDLTMGMERKRETQITKTKKNETKKQTEQSTNKAISSLFFFLA